MRIPGIGYGKLRGIKKCFFRGKLWWDRMLCNKNINVINKNHNKHCTFYPDVIEDMGYILKSCPSAEKVLTKSNLNINQCLPLTLWLKKNISHSSQGLDFVPKIVLFFFNSPFGVLG